MLTKISNFYRFPVTKQIINLPFTTPVTRNRSIIVPAFKQYRYMSNEAKKDKLIVFDTTLRDGEQSPGVTFKTEEKLEIARHLSSLGVDVIEAGFPIASQGDFEAVARIAREVGPSMNGRDKIGKPVIIAGLSRATEKDIKRCYDAVSQAPLHRIHTFLATSDIHLKFKLKIDREECIRRAAAAVAYARSLCNDVEFSSEDSGRSDKDFLCLVLEKVIEAGVTTVNIPDTVGYNNPEEYGGLIKYLIENTRGSDKVIWSTHCHDDLGLATANTLSGVLNGARQIEVSINGIGERAGNTPLEEVIMNIHTHPNSYPVYHTINTQQIYRTSNLVSSLSGMVVQPNKAIVGANAFLHESGIHQDGVLKNKLTYEILRPEDVGILNVNLVLGKLSGRNAFRSRLIELGYSDMNEDEISAAFERFKALADTKKRVTEHDLLALLSDQVSSGTVVGSQRFNLQSIQVVSGTHEMSTATVKLLDIPENKELIDAAIGRTGPIMAVFGAIQRLVQRKVRLLHYEVRAVSEGMDALGKVIVKITDDVDFSLAENGSPEVEVPIDSRVLTKSTYHGHGTDVDVVTASAKAYINAINRMFEEEHYAKTGLGRSSLPERRAEI
ncbi:17505_t:CDS:2 [Funneliformis geosporum]|uniref:2-isopropylmalate synthase n=1 Tax=Funneliformis geosporum TaxID=1117311 RepID=A0A9W4SBY9_9GLOM|nr:14028_t:CDS:2 [Funneliformis geosporum]CAI2163724.1 17505_t:CDS:2 [Funneliformis geosporum]